MYTFLLSWCLFFMASASSLDCEKDDPIVIVSQGKLKGAEKQLLDGTPYYSFKGIPYARPPVGKLRFKAPEPPEPWQGTLDAINHGPVCPQFDSAVEQFVEGNENCLFLNVYTKSLQPSSKLPVMVFIHGGSFMSGSGDASYGFGPEFLLQHDVILVTMNYRLEVLGFLCLDTPEVPGNAGLKDQAAALRWVRANIAHFGGDPDKVTLFGESSGSISVISHMHSPMSTGLFHKAIAQSGVSIQEWGQVINGKDRAYRAAKALGKDTNDTQELLDFLRSVPAIKLARLTEVTRYPEEELRGIANTFIPVVEKKFNNIEQFLTEDPLQSLLHKKTNPVPLMIGYNSAEAIIMLDYQMNRINFTNANSQYLVPREITNKVSVEKTKEFGERIKNFYAGNRNFTTSDETKVVNMYSDLYFTYEAHRFLQFYTEVCKASYMYKFDCDTDLNFVKNATGKTYLKGASHADELFYIFYSPLNQGPYNAQPKLKEIVYRVTKLWTNFAKTGNPTPDNSLGVTWPRYSPASRDYLEIDEQFSVGRYADRERIEFLNQLYCEAGLPCIRS